MRRGISSDPAVGSRREAPPGSNCSKRSATTGPHAPPGARSRSSSARTPPWRSIATGSDRSSRTDRPRGAFRSSAGNCGRDRPPRQHHPLHVVLRVPKGRAAVLDPGDRAHAYGKPARNRIDLPEARLMDDDPRRSPKGVDPRKRRDGPPPAVRADRQPRIGDATVTHGPGGTSAPWPRDRARRSVAAVHCRREPEERQRASAHANSLDDLTAAGNPVARNACSHLRAPLRHPDEPYPCRREPSVSALQCDWHGRRRRPVDQAERRTSPLGTRAGRRRQRGGERAEGREPRPSAHEPSGPVHPHANRRTPLNFVCARYVSIHSFVP